MNKLQPENSPQLSPRLFFALWPDDETRRELSALQRGLKRRFPRARWIPPERLHLTLHFLGRLPLEQARRCRELARAVRGERFELRLERLGCFPRPRVLWLGPSRVVAALQSLQEDLAGQLVAVGYRMQFNTYRPHVTLARKVAALPQESLQPDGLPIAWPARDFVLVESVDTPEGVAYRVVERYPLEVRR